MSTTRVTSVNAISFLVPDVGVGTGAGGAVIDFDALPPSPAAQAQIDDAQTDATQALADAATAQATADAALLSPQVLVVRTAADLPAAVAGVRTIAAPTHALFVIDAVDLGTDRLVVPDHFCIMGAGSPACAIITANASPLVTGKSLAVRDVDLRNTAGPCIRMQGSVAADPTAGLSVIGCGFVGSSASGAVQIHNADYAIIKNSAWTLSSGVGVRYTGTTRVSYYGESFVRGNAAGFTWMEIPGAGAATISEQVVVHAVGFDLADGGNGISADPAALAEEGLHVEICVFPAPGTPGIGSPIVGVTADDPECHFAGNLNLENTHVRGILTIAANATATTVSNTTDYFKLAGTTTLTEASLFDSPAAGVLRVLSSGTTLVRLTAFLTLTTAVNNQDLLVAFAVTANDGAGPTTLLSAFVQEGVTGGTAGLRINALPLMAITTLQQNDRVDVRVRNTSGANNVTWRHGQVYAEQING